MSKFYLSLLKKEYVYLAGGRIVSPKSGMPIILFRIEMEYITGKQFSKGNVSI